MEFFIISLLNGVGYGLLLFMLSAGLTLIFSMMGVLNFAHASFYMLGAYMGYSAARLFGFWPALIVAPLAVGILGAAFQRLCLRNVHKLGHVPELLVTFGLSYVVLEVVQLLWGRTSLEWQLPEMLSQPAFTLASTAGDGMHLLWGAPAAGYCSGSGTAATTCTSFPATRALMMGVALFMLLALWLLLTLTRVGLVIKAALTHPHMVEALGHNVPAIYTLVFGTGTALAGLAGVVGGSTFVTEPGMAATVGALVFVVVVVGGVGSLMGAFVASLVIGLVQTFAVASDHRVAGWAGIQGGPTVAQLAPLIPYVLLVLVLALRPSGLLGSRTRP